VFSDAQRLGLETDIPNWMFEVGFAKLAFVIMGFMAVFAKRGHKRRPPLMPVVCLQGRNGRLNQDDIRNKG